MIINQSSQDQNVALEDADQQEILLEIRSESFIMMVRNGLVQIGLKERKKERGFMARMKRRSQKRVFFSRVSVAQRYQ